jgi:general secretion pathway protein D
MNEHLRTAYDIGRSTAQDTFMKWAEGEASLGDPNFWQGGTPSPEEEAAAAAPPPPASAEEAVAGLPAGAFQGLQMKLTPDGQRNTSVKVTPDVLAQPEGVMGIFQAEPGAKVEIAAPEPSAEAGPEGGAAGPAEGVPGAPPPPGMAPEGGMPPEGMPPEGAPPA